MIILFGFLIGAFLGSFVLCMADRSLTKETFFGRSFCPKCKKTLKWYDLFPIFSYLLLKGKCRFCHKKIPLEYLLVELLMGGLIALLFSQQIHSDVIKSIIQISSWGGLFKSYLIPVILTTTFKAFTICVFVAVFITDIKTYLIPDRITYPSIVAVFLFYILFIPFNIFQLYLVLSKSPVGKFLLPPYSNYFWLHAYQISEPFIFSLLGALIIGLFFATLIFITKGRGMGGGDLKLGIFIGLALGFPNCIVALMLAFFLGSIVGGGLLLLKRKHFGQVIPFGPFLSIGSLIALFWADQIIRWYIAVR